MDQMLVMVAYPAAAVAVAVVEHSVTVYNIVD